MEQNNISEEKDKEEIKAKPNQKKRNRKKIKRNYEGFLENNNQNFFQRGVQKG